jgi:predicted nuclease with TOPRIM domain
MSDAHLDDEQIQQRIDELEDERGRLRRAEEQAATEPDELARLRARLEEIRVELDRLFDLRHQRRALRSAGQDPDQAQERDPGTVEGYLG